MNQSSQQREPYRQAIPTTGVSLERNTGRVPGDGFYYVLVDGEVKGRYRDLRRARLQYKEMVAATGWKPAPPEKTTLDPSRDEVERYLDRLEDYWTDSHKHARRGGKTMYRS